MISIWDLQDTFIPEERNAVILGGDPLAARRYIWIHGGERPPVGTDWRAVFAAARGLIGHGNPDDFILLRDRSHECRAAEDLVFPRLPMMLRLAEWERNRRATD